MAKTRGGPSADLTDLGPAQRRIDRPAPSGQPGQRQGKAVGPTHQQPSCGTPRRFGFSPLPVAAGLYHGAGSLIGPPPAASVEGPEKAEPAPATITTSTAHSRGRRSAAAAAFGSPGRRKGLAVEAVGKAAARPSARTAPQARTGVVVERRRMTRVRRESRRCRTVPCRPGRREENLPANRGMLGSPASEDRSSRALTENSRSRKPRRWPGKTEGKLRRPGHPNAPGPTAEAPPTSVGTHWRGEDGAQVEQGSLCRQRQ